MLQADTRKFFDATDHIHGTLGIFLKSSTLDEVRRRCYYKRLVPMKSMRPVPFDSEALYTQ